MAKESEFQKKLKDRLKEQFPGCMVLKNDPNQIQGVPDLTVLYEDKWAALEVKRSQGASHRPNQNYYIDKMSKMSYASFVSPENVDEVFKELEEVFK
jgi:hypothetical protein